MRYLGKARLDRYAGRFEFVVFMAKVFIGAAAAIVGTMGWVLILDAIVNGGR